MLGSYLKTACRKLVREKGYAAISLSGLTMGLAACFLIGLFLRHELRYDRFHEEADRIYRVVMDTPIMATSNLPAGAASAFEQIPEVRSAVRALSSSATIIRNGSPIREENLMYVDSSFFEVFSFDLVKGRGSEVLNEPREVVLTLSTAQRYFGTTDVVGRTLERKEGEAFRVSGLMADPPTNSHLQFGMVAAYRTLGRPESFDAWEHSGSLYLLRTETATTSQLGKSVSALAEGSVDEISSRLGFGMHDMALAIQPITDIHLGSALDGAIAPSSDPRLLYILGFVALIVLLIACFNYTNLATARATERAQEVGLRKTVGAPRSQIAVQFLVEAMILCAVAAGLAIAAARLVFPWFQDLIGVDIPFIPAGAGAAFVLLFVLLALMSGLLSGAYPALVLARYRPIEALTGRFSAVGGNGLLRKGLITAQFVIAIGLIASTFGAQSQLQFLRDKPLGYETENLISVSLPDESAVQPATWRDEMASVPGVASASLAYDVPLHTWTGQFSQDGETRNADVLYVDEHYLETLQIELAEGRGFSAKRAADSTKGIILNETAARFFNVTDQVGRQIQVDLVYENPTLIGIVEDFHTNSLHQAIGPVILAMNRDRFDHMLLRLGESNTPNVLSRLEHRWSDLAPATPFTYEFFSDQVARLHENARRLARSITWGGGVALLLACGGLFGLANYMAQKRKKELAIRKVLGATLRQIVTLLTSEFTRLVGLACLIGLPLAYLGLRWWLQEFAYRTTLGPGLFLLSGLLVAAVALVAVAYQALRAGTINPAVSLRNE